MNQGQTRAILEAHFSRLARAVSEGYAEFLRSHVRRGIMRPSTQASAINDEVFAKVVQEFDGVPGFRVVESPKDGLRFLAVGELILLWFKKIDSRRMVRIYPTNHAQSLQAAQTSLFPDRAVLIVGFKTNSERSAISLLSIIKPNGKLKPHWYIDLQLKQPAKMPVSPTQQSKKPRVKVKLGEVQQNLMGEG